MLLMASILTSMIVVKSNNSPAEGGNYGKGRWQSLPLPLQAMGSAEYAFWRPELRVICGKRAIGLYLLVGINEAI